MRLLMKGGIACESSKDPYFGDVESVAGIKWVWRVIDFAGISRLALGLRFVLFVVKSCLLHGRVDSVCGFHSTGPGWIPSRGTCMPTEPDACCICV